MPAVDLVIQYLDIFFSGENLTELYDIFSADLKFHGPWINCTSPREYIESLQEDPPEECSYEIIHIFEKNNYVNIIYRFKKPGITTLMSQLFEVHNEKIVAIQLIFDSATFKEG